LIYLKKITMKTSDPSKPPEAFGSGPKMIGDIEPCIMGL
jgi:hypothetical protein